MNLIRNGNFESWPLGTAFAIPTGAATNALGGDLSYVTVGASQPPVTISRRSFVFGDTLEDGAPHYYLEFAPTIGLLGPLLTSAYLKYVISGDLTLKNRVGTFTFYANATVDRKIVIQVTRQFVNGVGPGGASEVVCQTRDLQLTKGWRKYQVQFRSPDFFGATHGSSDVTNVKIFFQGDAATLGTHQVQWKASTVSFSQFSYVPYGIQEFDTPSIATSTSSAGTQVVLEAPTDGIGDAGPAMIALGSAQNVLVRAGTYYVSSGTFSVGGTWTFEQGAVIKPASGVKITFNNTINAGRTQIFNVTLGGQCVLGFFGGAMMYMYPEWWGAIPNNSLSGGANDTAFGAIYEQTLTSVENKQTLLLDIGYYNFSNGFTLRSKSHLKAPLARSCRLQWQAPAASGTFIKLPANADNVEFEGIHFDPISVPAGVRTIGVGHLNAADNVSNLTFKDCVFTGWNQHAINIGSAIYLHVSSTEFFNINNLASLGGTGVNPAICINVQTYANAVLVNNQTRVGDCEQFLKTVSSAVLEIVDSGFEQSQSGGLAIDGITGKGNFIDFVGESLRVQGNYFEGIRVDFGFGLVGITGTVGYTVADNRMTGLRPGGLSVCSCYVKGNANNHGGIVSGNEFYGTPSFYIIQNASGSGIVHAPNNVFRKDDGTYFTTYSSLKAKMSPGVTHFSCDDSFNFATQLAARIFTTGAGIQYPFIIEKDSNGVAGANGDGVGFQMKGYNDAITERVMADIRSVWSNAGSGVDAADFIIKTFQVGNQRDALKIRGSGSVIFSGGIGTTPRLSAVDTPMTTLDGTVVLTATGKTVTVNTSSNMDLGQILTVKLLIGGAGTGTVAFANGSDRIDGAATYTLSADNKYVTFQLVAVNKWAVIANN